MFCGVFVTLGTSGLFLVGGDRIGREGESQVSRRQALLALMLLPAGEEQKPLASKVGFRWGQKALL